jgi:hypothetical protein
VLRGSVIDGPPLPVPGDRAAQADLLRVARDHGVLPLLQRRLADGALAPELAEDLARRHLANRREHDVLAADLRVLAGVLDGTGAPWALVKGPVLAHGAYGDAALRQVGDLDVLVDPARFAALVGTLEAAGMPVDDRNWSFLLATGAGQLHLVLPGGSDVDLHWSLLFTRGERARYPIPTAELLARRRTVELAGLAVPTLDPADTVVHLALHAAKEGADRLGWLVDLERAIAAWPVDWDALVARAAAWGVGLPVATVLQRAALEVGAGVPAPVLRRLAPRAWLLAAGGLDRAFPVAATTRRVGTMASLVARGAYEGGTVGGATAAVARGLGRRVAAVVRERRFGRRALVRPADEVTGLGFRSGGPAERADYLARVASDTWPPRAAPPAVAPEPSAAGPEAPDQPAG